MKNVKIMRENNRCENKLNIFLLINNFKYLSINYNNYSIIKINQTFYTLKSKNRMFRNN